MTTAPSGLVGPARRQRCPCSRTRSAAGHEDPTCGRFAHLAGSTDAGDAARQHHHGNDLASSAHPRVACAAGEAPDGEDLEAEPRAGVDELKDDGEPHAQDEAQRDDDGRTWPAERPDEEHHGRHRQEDEGLEPTLRQALTQPGASDERNTDDQHDEEESSAGLNVVNHDGQWASSSRRLPCGNVLAAGERSRQYERLSKMR